LSEAHSLHAVDGRFWRGVEHFDAGDYFAAHELWESLWLEVAGAEKVFLAGLIQVAAGLLKRSQGRIVGATRLLTRSRARLAETAVATPVDIVAVCDCLRRELVDIESGLPSQPWSLPLTGPRPG